MGEALGPTRQASFYLFLCLPLLSTSIIQEPAGARLLQKFLLRQ